MSGHWRSGVLSRCSIALGLFAIACGGGNAHNGPGGTGGAGLGSDGAAMRTGGDAASSGGEGADARNGGGSGGADADTPNGAAADGDAARTTDVGTGAEVAVAPCVPGAGTELIGTASVRDRATCLIWQRQAGVVLMTNKQAAKFCGALAQDGLTDWRVPAPEELATWPNLAANGNAYITNPIYIPNAGTVADGCTGNSHSCNLSEYNTGSLGCAWQGVDFAGPTVCVRGTALPGTTAAQFAAPACEACKAHVGGGTADFHVADCSPYTP
ncbi:MAG TPA: hypothetical protein VMU50_21975 [Polyangia bacterium]|nr:hypothetical protein [Polyangia bacterium]